MEGHWWKQERALEGNLQEERGTASGESWWITSSVENFHLHFSRSLSSWGQRAGRAFWRRRDVFRLVRRSDETVTCVCVRVWLCSLAACSQRLFDSFGSLCFSWLKKNNKKNWEALRCSHVHRGPPVPRLFCFLQVVASKSRREVYRLTRRAGSSWNLSTVSRLAVLRRRCAIQPHFVYEQFSSESCDGIGQNNMKKKRKCVIVLLLVLYKCILGCKKRKNEKQWSDWTKRKKKKKSSCRLLSLHLQSTLHQMKVHHAGR